MHHTLIISAIKLLLYEMGGEAPLYGVQGERTRRAADVTGTAKKITDALQTRLLGVNKRPTGAPSTARFRNQLIAACVSEHRRTPKDRKGDTHCPEPHGSFPSRRHSHNPKRGNRLKLDRRQLARSRDDLGSCKRRPAGGASAGTDRRVVLMAIIVFGTPLGCHAFSPGRVV
jgi:hypothetical protein